MSKKQKKIFKIIIISLAVFLIGELIFFGIRYYNNRKENTFYSIVSGAIITEKGYIGAGLSDYRYSDFNEYDGGYQKPTIFVNENNKVINEISLDLGYNGFYNDIVETKDGYIAVGGIEMTKDQNKNMESEGIIVKYDKKFKLVWRENFNILGKTEFTKVKLDKDGNIIVVGSSIYASGYMGNHQTGGGILLKYNQEGEKQLQVNHGGPYAGRFNDVIIEDDGYVVVGLGKKNSGVIIKYNKKGKKVWDSSYGYTDEKGIMAIEKYKNKYITATTKVVSKDDLSTYQASIVVFDTKGNKVDNVKYSSNKITAFTDVKVINDEIYACGHTGTKSNNKLVSDAIIVKYDKDLYEEKTNHLKGDNNDFYNNIYEKDKKILVLGYSNSDIKEYDLNGYDYSPFIKEYKSDLK